MSAKIIIRNQYTNSNLRADFQVLKFENGECTEMNLTATYQETLQAASEAQGMDMDFAQEMNENDGSLIVVYTFS